MYSTNKKNINKNKVVDKDRREFITSGLKLAAGISIPSIFGTAILKGTATFAKENTMPEPMTNKMEVTGGTITGIHKNGLNIFKGIPFAAPPVGDLRWRAPQPVQPWSGVLKADKFSKSAPQIIFPNASSMNNEVGEQSEDCLYLNVWAPENNSNKKLPVMIWIHGGGFAIGAPSMVNYNGAELAQKGVVVVSLAYRLGALGFMAHPDLTAESVHKVSGNYGILDQIAGLKWVRDNISKFGGNPENVTIFGESAGGISVSILCASPIARGLFHKAISQSGGAFGPVTEKRENGTTQNLSGAEQHGVEFAKRMGAESITELRRLTPQEILKDDQSAGMGGFWPICDGYVITEDQYKLYQQGKFADVPVIIGTNADEGALFIHDITIEYFESMLHKTFGKMKDEALKIYPSTDKATALQSVRNLFRDQAFAWPSWAWARLQAENGKSEVFVYLFDQPQPPRKVGMPLPKAAHADDVNYVFGHTDSNFNFDYTDGDRRLSSVIMDYWTNFAKNGNPNQKDLPHWPEFDNGPNSVLYLNSQNIHTGPVHDLQQIEFMDEYYKTLRNPD